MIIKTIQTKPILPNFLIVGVGKRGTTSLYYYLKQHPNIFMSSIKEPKFFSGRFHHPGAGPGDDLKAIDVAGLFSDYYKLFAKGNGKKAVSKTTSAIHYQTFSACYKYLKKG